MPKVFNADTGTEDFAADPAPPARDYDLAPVTFGTDTFRNPFFWILVGVAGTMAVQYILSKRSKE